MTWVLTKDDGMMSWHLGAEKLTSKLALPHQKWQFWLFLAMFGQK
jgi:hypothetical protein